MSIDINSELKRMADEWGLSEKEVVSNWRNFVRFAWGKSIFKLEFLKQHAIKVKNDNPRSAKRFPTVTKYQCNICKEYFTMGQLEIDHVYGENTLKSFDDAENFFKAITLPHKDELQILCKDQKRTVKGKKVLSTFGCHSLKSYAERYNVSFEQAKAEKQALEIIKQKRDKEWLTSYDIIPESTQAKRREQIVNKILETKT